MTNRVVFCSKDKTIKKFNSEINLNDFSALSLRDTELFKSSNSSVFAVKTKLASEYEKFVTDFQNIRKQINCFTSIEKDKNQTFEVFKQLLESFTQLTLASLETKLNETEFQIAATEIKAVKSYVFGHLNLFNTVYKRKQQLKKSISFVEPEEKAIGLKWHAKQNTKSCLPDHTIQQATMQYVPIKKTLECLFQQENFKQMYFEHNSNRKHNCREGVYKQSCCARTHMNCPLYDDKYTIKIRLATDGCEVCDPLKTKNVTHKLNCVYFTIENLPEKFLSKTDNLFLVSLCEAANLKIGNNNFDTIAEIIKDEMMDLETVGIEVDGRILKAGLGRIISDNLGINGALGFVECFNSYFCRVCETSKEMSTHMVKEDPNIMRTKESYAKCVEIAEKFIESGEKIDLKKTKGIKRLCIFNELSSFNVLENITLDVMHDVNEGIIPFYLHSFFEYCDTKNIVKKNEMMEMIRDFNYGFLNSRNRPSTLMFERTNLGQNATHSYTIMIHLPFIFERFNENLKDIWISAESLMSMMRVIYSRNISEEDIARLSTDIEVHYNFLIDIFKTKLIPKHHNVLHYPSAIRQIGPLINYWMMRFESKHLFFTTAAKRTNNFVNIAKTLAFKHQEALSYKTFATDQIEFSKRNSNFKSDNRYSIYCNHIEKCIGQAATQNLQVLKFATFNSFEYREGCMLLNEKIFQIVLILSHENKLLFFCKPCKVKQFDSFHNSIEIEMENDNISDTNLKNPRSYEMKISENKMYLICDTLEFKKYM